MDYQIYPPEEIIDVTVELPLSKSFCNRLSIIQALATGTPGQLSADAPDDVTAIHNGLTAAPGSTVNIGAAGTAMRFLTAYFANKPGFEVILDGSERMRHRPVGILVEALRELGADIEYVNQKNYPPLKIKGKCLQGGTISVKSDVSSQYISALMLIAPYTENGIEIILEDNVVSLPYIKMTAELMRRCGARVDMDRDKIVIPNGIYSNVDLKPELDWSAASYWAEIVALSAGFVSLPGLSRQALQGDSLVVDYFEPLGVTTLESEDSDGLEMVANPEIHSRLNLDLEGNPDLVQGMAVTCVMLNIPFRFTGLSTLRIKETDRLEALSTELLKFGCIVEVEGDSILEWDGRRFPMHNLPVINTYDDHRMAMAFAPAALYIPGLIVRDAAVVKKSYPQFWEEFLKAGFSIEEVNAEDIQNLERL